MKVRFLTEADAEAFQRVRLRSLQEHPESFGADYEDEKDTPLEKIVESFRDYLPNTGHFGAFEGDQLIGITSVFRNNHQKSRHRAQLTRMYAVPEMRGRGVGQALLQAAIDFAREMEGLEDLILAVTVGNIAARSLYIAAGFQPFAIDPRYLKIGDTYYDMEVMLLHLRDKARRG